MMRVLSAWGKRAMEEETISFGRLVRMQVGYQLFTATQRLGNGLLMYFRWTIFVACPTF